MGSVYSSDGSQFDVLDPTRGAIRSRVDERSDRPDRRTVYLTAPEMTIDDRMTHWLTADDRAFVDLDSMR
jgi:hypothetical protein